MLDAATINRFEIALAAPTFGGLKDLAKEMAGEGLSQVAICELFDSYRQHLAGAHRQVEAALLRRAVECIVGWCGRDSWWFEHPMTKDEIDACGKIPF